MSRFLCLSRSDNAVLYEAASLPQARGFCEGHDEPTHIVCSVDTLNHLECLYRVTVIDDLTGQTVCQGPILNLFEATEALFGLRLVLLPVESGVEA